MKKTPLFIALVFASVLLIQPSYAQTSTEVYLFDIELMDGEYTLMNPRNVSDNDGYDNQPSFTADGKGLLFASTRGDQTDILWYDLSTATKRWLSDTEGGEYSPVLMPSGKHISAVRLDPDGLQRLYRYPIKGGKPEVIVPELKIGYYAWYNADVLVSFVLGDPATLQKNDISSGISTVLFERPGRSIHKIPNTDHFSFMDQSKGDEWLIKAYNPSTGNATLITETLKGSQDMAWLDSDRILMGKDSKLYMYHTKESTGWMEFHDLKQWGLSEITRLTVHPTGKHLAVVVSGK
ncbi:TolB family protein [Balneola vulgaris]|uniref:TolB family protein n=1 Tax=Balneola vulgaris TaxID=287535 RepID=UPI00035EE649|nr:PD40 domain-containing protein [Balneola vulgaris]